MLFLVEEEFIEIDAWESDKIQGFLRNSVSCIKAARRMKNSFNLVFSNKENLTKKKKN